MNYRHLYYDLFRVFNSKKLSYQRRVLLCLFFFICILVQPADAHKVNIFAYAENGRIYAEGYFVDGSKCKNSIIEVLDMKTGEKLLEGNTDEKGQFSFDIPRATSMKLILHAGMGHQNEYTLTEEEVREAMQQPGGKKEKLAEQKKQTQPRAKLIKKEQPAGIQYEKKDTDMAFQDMDAVIERAIDRKLQPVMKILLNLQKKSEKPGLTEILGGIGYIIGILGIIAYLKGRSKTRSH